MSIPIFIYPIFEANVQMNFLYSSYCKICAIQTKVSDKMETFLI